MGDNQIEQYKTEISICREGILKSALGLIFILKNTSKLLSCNQNNLNHLCFYHAELIVTLH